MKNPTIKHRIVQYADRLWVLQKATFLSRSLRRNEGADIALGSPVMAFGEIPANERLYLALVDGDETVCPEVTWQEYEGIMASCPLQEFSLAVNPVVDCCEWHATGGPTTGPHNACRPVSYR